MILNDGTLGRPGLVYSPMEIPNDPTLAQIEALLERDSAQVQAMTLEFELRACILLNLRRGLKWKA